MKVHVLKVTNLHCHSCEDDVRHTVSTLDPTASVEFGAARQYARIEASDTFDIQQVVQTLVDRGFEVVAVDSTPLSQNIADHDSWWFSRLAAKIFRDPRGPKAGNERQEQHRKICAECKGYYQQQSGEGDLGEHQNQSPERTKAFRAVYSVQGMTCSSCAQAITTAVRSAVPDVQDVLVDVVGGSTYVLLPSKILEPRVTEAIRDAGYEPLLTEMLPVTEAADSGRALVKASIGGMTCGSCAATVKRAASALPFVTDASVDAVTGTAQFTVTDTDRLGELNEAIEDSGYTYEQVQVTSGAPSRSKARTVSLRVQGIYCDRCPERVMNTLREYGDAVEIVDPVTVDRPYIRFTYLPAPPQFTIRSILAELRSRQSELSFSVVEPRSLEELAAENLEKERRGILRRLVLVSILSVPAVLMMLGVHLGGEGPGLMMFLATPAYFFADDIFHFKALKELRSGVFSRRRTWRQRLLHFGSMNLLMSLGTSLSYWISLFMVVLIGPNQETYFDSVLFLTLFLLIGRYLDVYSKVRTSSAVSTMTNLRPDTVDLVSGQGAMTINTVKVALIEVGDTVAVLPGHKCAVDGVVSRGASDMNEAMLTGEALPVPKKPGDQVFAGSINAGNQRLVLKVGAVTKGTLLDDIVESVRQGQMHQAPIERYVETITGVFVPVVTYLALGVWLVWYIVGKLGFISDSPDVNWGVWSMQFAVATFVVACPCGIGLAAPTALYIGSGLAARYGILARGGGEAFQEGSRIDAICFDKTGTLTTGGNLRITDAWSSDHAHHDDLLRLAAALEAESTHPLATAVIDYAPSPPENPDDVPRADITQVSGRGRGVQADILAGKYAGQKALLGNERLLTEAGIKLSPEAQQVTNRYKSEGKSVILMSLQNRVVVVLAAADELRPEAIAVVRALQSRGVDCYMISGDNEQTAHVVAEQVGIPISNVLAEVLPEQKADRVKYLQRTAGQGGTSSYGRAIVAMVGDGINDAPALAASDVGVALGRGADIAVTSSQFVLVREDLRNLVTLVELSRAVMRRVRFNFFWAGVYNLLAVPGAAGVLYPWTHQRLDPVIASLAMALSSVSVMASSLLLRRFRPPQVKI